MTVTTTIYFIDPTTGTTTQVDQIPVALVPLKYESNSLKYEKDQQWRLVNYIYSENSASTPASLDIDITNGSGWYIKKSEEVMTISGGPASGGLRWIRSGSDMMVHAWYPDVSSAKISWHLTDAKEPPVKLKVVVKRV